MNSEIEFCREPASVICWVRGSDSIVEGKESSNSLLVRLGGLAIISARSFWLKPTRC